MILGFSKTFPWGEPTNFVDKIKDGKKIHTIRTPRKGNTEWREGMDIHFATGVRTPDYNEFATGVCTGVQDIEIKNHSGPIGKTLLIYVDGWMLPKETAEELAINDGFDSLEQFFKWFDEDFEGRLIHWTDKRY